jgi:hypothetical protein
MVNFLTGDISVILLTQTMKVKVHLHQRPCSTAYKWGPPSLRGLLRGMCKETKHQYTTQWPSYLSGRDGAERNCSGSHESARYFTDWTITCLYRQNVDKDFHIRTVHLDIIQVIYSPNDCTSYTLTSTDNELPEDGVTTPKHVWAILMKILILFLRKSLVHSLVNK